MLLGSEKGNLFLYQAEAKNLTGNWSLVSETTGGLMPGRQSKPALFDINQDGKLELVVGNKRGGLGLFNTPYESTIVTSNRHIPKLEGVSIFPNPSAAQMVIRQTSHPGSWRVQVSNLAGQLMHLQETSNSKLHLTVTEWPSGIYLVKVQAAEKWTIERFIKN